MLVGMHACGSTSVVVSMQGVRIQDMRHASAWRDVGSSSEGADSVVLAIGGQWPEVCSGALGESSASTDALGSSSSQRLRGSSRALVRL